MRMLSLFSGIGAFEKALENIGLEVEVVNFCEIDKYASVSYCAIHGEDMSKNLGDITQIDFNTLPRGIDILTHGSPCQDFSIAGNGAGAEVGSNTRSSLMWNSVQIISTIRPKYVVWENVKNVLSVKHKHNFDKYIQSLEVLGYKNYYQVLNAKDYGMPQNRERIFVVSILGEHEPFEFPQKQQLNIRLKDLLIDEVEEKYYIPQDKTDKLISSLLERVAVEPPVIVASRGINTENPNSRKAGLPTEQRLEINSRGLSNTLTSVQKDNYVLDCIGSFDKEDINDNERQRRVYSEDGISPSVLARTDSPKVITVGHLPYPNSNKMHQSNQIIDSNGLSPTLDTCTGGNRMPKIMEQYRIRKLTPLECYRLMGFGDVDFNKAKKALNDTYYKGQDRSNSQLYKQAGNSIVVNVLEEIFKKLLL